MISRSALAQSHLLDHHKQNKIFIKCNSASGGDESAFVVKDKIFHDLCQICFISARFHSVLKKMPDENSFSFSIFSYPDATLRGQRREKTFFNVTTFQNKSFLPLSQAQKTVTFVYVENLTLDYIFQEKLDKISYKFLENFFSRVCESFTRDVAAVTEGFRGIFSWMTMVILSIVTKFLFKMLYSKKIYKVLT